MRIGLFTNNYRPLVNGLVTSVDSFADAFRRAGHDVVIIAPRYGGGLQDPEGVLRVPGLRAPTHHAYVLPFSGWPGIRRAVRSLGLDVYHAQHPFLLGAAAARGAREADRPLIFTYHTRYERYAHYVPGPAGMIGNLALRRALAFARRADLVIAPASSVARDLVALGLRTPVAVIPTGVELPPIPSADRRLAARHAFDLEDGGPVCLSVGRLAKEKNPAFLLHAFHHIAHSLPDARLVLVGDGDERQHLSRLAVDLGVQARVRFVGAVPHDRVSAYTRTADLFLFASTSETQGLAALEALAAGLPVVAVASAAAVDLLPDESAGLICAEDPEIFAGKAVALWEARDRRIAMAEAARRIAARYAPDASAGALLDLYARAMRARCATPAAETLHSREART
jgi:1,2-diacylglycerol 3-alpha-glucosyltransferase